MNTDQLIDVQQVAKKEMGLYDSATGDSVLATKIVDATEFCRESKRCVIKYGEVKRGALFQICDWYEANEDMGATIHYFLDEQTPEQLSQCGGFELRAFLVGIHPLKLAEFIYENRP